MQKYRHWSIFIGLMTVASMATGGDFDGAVLEPRLQEMVKRLDLTDLQINQLRPLLQESTARQKDVLESYGIDPDALGTGGQSLGMREAMAMRKDMIAVREELRGAAGQILSEGQMREFKAIQEERAASMREKILAGRHR